MPSERILFDGYDLTGEFTATDVVRPLPAATYDAVSVPSADGVRVRGRTLGEIAITMNLWAHGGTRRDRRDSVRRIAALLVGDDAGKLAFSDDGGLYYLAHVSATTVTEYFDAVCVAVEFKVSDPAMYGAKRSIVVPSGGSAVARVGGTYPTRPKISAASAVRKSSSGVWGVRLDDGDFLHVETGSASARAVTLDCAERECTVAGAVALPTLDSDWFELEPGEHKIAIDNGTGACTVEWQERWL